MRNLLKILRNFWILKSSFNFLGRCNLSETMIKKMAFGIFSSGDLIQSGWIAELRTRVKYGIYIMLNRECSLIFKQTSWVVQIDKGTTCNFLTENVNCFEIKIICMSILKLLLLRVFNVEYIKTKISDTTMIKFGYVISYM